MAMITLVEYAKRHGKEPASAKHKAQRGGFQTAVKMGRDWMIDEDEPYVDRRITNGNSIGVHRARAQKEAERKKQEMEP